MGVLPHVCLCFWVARLCLCFSGRVWCLGASECMFWVSLYVRVSCAKEFWVCVGGRSMNSSCKFRRAKNVATLFS